MKKLNTKAISYAHPSSALAKALGFKSTGCYFILHTVDDRRIQPKKGYLTYIDKELVRLFKATPGEVCEFSQRNHPQYYY